MKLLTEITNLLDDEDLGVRREAIYFLCLKQKDRATELLHEFLTHQNPRLQTAAIAAMAEHQMEEASELLSEDTLEIFLVRADEDAETGRVEVAKLLGLLQGDHYRVFLAQLMADRSQRVVKAAISSAGRKKDFDFVPQLLEMLADPLYRPDAKAALVTFGVKLLPILKQHLILESETLAIRRNIPSILSQIESQQSVELLMETALSVHPDLKTPIVMAMNRLRNNVPGLRFSSRRVVEIVVAEAQTYFDLLKVLSYFADVIPERSKATASRLLSRALQERLDQALERIFRLLGLAYPSQDIYTAYLGITSKNRISRANALEFLDNILKGRIRELLLPLLDDAPRSPTLGRAATANLMGISSSLEALEYLLRGNDGWLKSCALYYICGNIPESLAHLVEEASGESNEIVRETALLALSGSQA